MMLIQLNFLFICSHYLMDVVLQSEKLARGKNRHSKNTMYDPAIHGPKAPTWIFDLSAHALSHALAVYIVTKYVGGSEKISLMLGIIEFFLHWVIDFYKGEKKYGIFEDQAMHLGCKWFYMTIIILEIKWRLF